MKSCGQVTWCQLLQLRKVGVAHLATVRPCSRRLRPHLVEQPPQQDEVVVDDRFGCQLGDGDGVGVVEPVRFDEPFELFKYLALVMRERRLRFTRSGENGCQVMRTDEPVLMRSIRRGSEECRRGTPPSHRPEGECSAPASP